MKSPVDAAIEGLWSGRRTGDAGSDNTREAEDQSDSNAITRAVGVDSKSA